MSYVGITYCDNVQCPSHTNCLRWQLWKDGGEGFLYAATFAPKSPYAQKCRFYLKPKDNAETTDNT